MATARAASGYDRDAAQAARQATLEVMHTQLAARVVSLDSMEGWGAWLRFAKSFHRYSFNNTVLIWAQRPDATLIAGYRAWQANGRQVLRGETAIKVFGPITKREPRLDREGQPVRDVDGKPLFSVRIVGLKPVSVFDVSQTDGDPIPERPVSELLTGQAPPGLWGSLQRLVEAEGYAVARGDCGGANGRTDFVDHSVRVRDDIDDAQAVKTLAHEAGHVLLHQPDARQGLGVCRGRGEVEAESVAYLVTAAHGVDSGQYTFSYVAGWAETAQAAAPKDTTLADVISATGARVVKAADTILTTTKPPTAVQTDATPESVTREMRVDQALAQGHQTARTRPAARREPAPSRAGHPTVAPAR